MARYPLLICVAFAGCCLTAPRLFAQASPPVNAADLYIRAAKLIVAYSPAETADIFPDYPPFGNQWDRLAKDAFEKNAPALELARRARSVDEAVWPAGFIYNKCRSLANELADAAEYQHFRGDDAGAFESIQDLMHLCAMLRLHPTRNSIRALVAAGIEGLETERIEVISCSVHLTTDPNDLHGLQTNVAMQIIGQLLDQPDPASLVPGASPSDPLLRRMFEIFTRANAERTFAAMSLACQLFRFDQHRWPNSLDEIVPAYLPSAPVDPWGDGKQTFGYALIKGGLPSGGDRPLLYDRYRSKDGLFYRTDIPIYWYSTGDGSQMSPDLQKQGGQFRDVASWHPAPTTRPLE